MAHAGQCTDRGSKRPVKTWPNPCSRTLPNLTNHSNSQRNANHGCAAVGLCQRRGRSMVGLRLAGRRASARESGDAERCTSSGCGACPPSAPLRALCLFLQVANAAPAAGWAPMFPALVEVERSLDPAAEPTCLRLHCHRPSVRMPMAWRMHREGVEGPGAKPLGERVIEPLRPHLSRAYARDRADPLSLVHRSTPDAVVTEASI